MCSMPCSIEPTRCFWTQSSGACTTFMAKRACRRLSKMALSSSKWSELISSRRTKSSSAWRRCCIA
uniref:Uncharacterized protein n=1 Tax=Hyaloperonospora arabidopsidis (strain Emoy2) TaxID=559515 RepID=M4C1X3_HYAAE